MNRRTIGQRLFTDGVAWPVYQDERDLIISRRL
jgi:hypothetical protein